MHSKELAAKLVVALEKTCPGIRYDYSLREIERVFDRTLGDEFCPTGQTGNTQQSSFEF